MKKSLPQRLERRRAARREKSREPETLKRAWGEAVSFAGCCWIVLWRRSVSVDANVGRKRVPRTYDAAFVRFPFPAHWPVDEGVHSRCWDADEL